MALRCRAQGVPRDLPDTAIEATGGTGEPQPIALAGGVPAVQVSRADLAVGSTLDGPAVVTQPDATTFIPQGWRATVDAGGNLEVIPA